MRRTPPAKITSCAGPVLCEQLPGARAMLAPINIEAQQRKLPPDPSPENVMALSVPLGMDSVSNMRWHWLINNKMVK